MPHPFDDMKKRLEAALKRIPQGVGVLAVNFYKRAWDRQGYLDARLERWAKRKDEDAGRAILVKTGRLRRSIRLISVDGGRIVIGTAGVVYAAAHNEGVSGTITVKAHTRKAYKRRKKGGKRRRIAVQAHEVQAHERKMNLPRRQFIGRSRVLERAIIKAIENELKNL
jgi:phage gpG-like protein